MVDPSDDDATRQPSVGSRDPSSPWSVEHFGFEHDPQRVSPAPPSAAAAPRMPLQTRPVRLRLLAAGALALGLVAGGTGFAAAQASTGGGDGHHAPARAGADG